MFLISKPYLMAAQIALGGTDLPAEDVSCLGFAIYHESRSESARGQKAVAHVVMNRVRDGRYPDTVCDVITQGGADTETGCQFSWWCDGVTDHPGDDEAWQEALTHAVAVLSGQTRDPTSGALFFFLVDMPTPSWAEEMTQTAVIEDHRFYRP
ncbi:MAG: cell wall hydrolase [Pseudomonadota bacterium]